MKHRLITTYIQKKKNVKYSSISISISSHPDGLVHRNYWNLTDVDPCCTTVQEPPKILLVRFRTPNNLTPPRQQDQPSMCAADCWSRLAHIGPTLIQSSCYKNPVSQSHILHANSPQFNLCTLSISIMATRIPENRRDWMCGTYCHEFEYFPTQPAASLSDMVFGFLEDGEDLPESVSSEKGCGEIENFDDEDGEKDSISNVEERKSYWENQHQILQVLSSVLFYHTLYIVNISLWGLLKYIMSLDSKAHLFLVYFVSTFL